MIDKELFEVKLVNRDKIFTNFLLLGFYVIIILQIINILTLQNNNLKNILFGMGIFNFISFMCNEIITIINFNRWRKHEFRKSDRT